MSTNIRVLITSLVVGIIYTAYAITLPPPSDPGFGAIAQFGGLVMGIVGISIVFGVIGFFATAVLDTSWGKRIKRALVWFGISLVVIAPLFLLITKIFSILNIGYFAD